MSKRYWFYVCGTGTLKGEHRVCFTANDNEASLTSLLQSAFCVKAPAFKLYAMLDEEGELMHYAQVRAAAMEEAPMDQEGEEDTPRLAKVVHRAFVSTNTVLNDLLNYAQAVAQPAQQCEPPPTLYVLVDCEADGAYTPCFAVIIKQQVPTVHFARVLTELRGAYGAHTSTLCTCSTREVTTVHSCPHLTEFLVAARQIHLVTAPRAPHPRPPPAT
jgi:hypothetical protein